MGVLFFVLTWTLLSLPIGIFVGKIIAEMDGRMGTPLSGAVFVLASRSSHSRRTKPALCPASMELDDMSAMRVEHRFVVALVCIMDDRHGMLPHGVATHEDRPRGRVRGEPTCPIDKCLLRPNASARRQSGFASMPRASRTRKFAVSFSISPLNMNGSPKASIFTRPAGCYIQTETLPPCCA